MTVICRRGEIWLIDFNPARGSEQKGVRPAVIIQNDIGNQYASTTIVAAITTTLKKYPVTVLCPPAETGLKHQSMINLAQILTVDKSRLLKHLGTLAPDTMREVAQAIKRSLAV